jgi:hypothetical protein
MQEIINKSLLELFWHYPCKTNIIGFKIKGASQKFRKYKIFLDPVLIYPIMPKKDSPHSPFRAPKSAQYATDIG